MTKVRPPLTIENALFRVLGAIGVERAREVTDRSEDYLRALSDPDTRYRLTCDDAWKLDLEHHTVTGDGYPIFETLGLMLAAEGAERFASHVELARTAVHVIKEGGEAHAALVGISVPGADPVQLRDTLRELEESAHATTKAIGLVKSMIEAEPEKPP